MKNKTSMQKFLTLIKELRYEKKLHLRISKSTLDFFPQILISSFCMSHLKNYIKFQTYWHFLLLPHSFYQAIVTLSSKQMQQFTTLSDKICAHHTFSSITLSSYQAVLFSDLSACFVFFIQKGEKSFSRASHTALLLRSMPFNDFPS